MTRILYPIWRVLFSIWYLAIFTSLTILTAFFALILCGLSMALVRRISGRLWSIICLAPARIRVETVGRERLPEGAGYIIFANHRSLLDIPTVTAATDQSISWVAKAALGRIPVFGWALKRIHLLVDRGGSAEAAKAMIAEAGARLSLGEILAIFPEGTRNKTDAPLLPFKKGAFILAKHSGVPLVPLAIARSGDLWPGGHLVPKSGLIKVAIGEPMIVSPGETLNQISKRAYEILESLYLSLQDEGAPKPVEGGQAQGEGGEAPAPDDGVQAASGESGAALGEDGQAQGEGGEARASSESGAALGEDGQAQGEGGEARASSESGAALGEDDEASAPADPAEE